MELIRARVAQEKPAPVDKIAARGKQWRMTASRLIPSTRIALVVCGKRYPAKTSRVLNIDDASPDAAAAHTSGSVDIMHTTSMHQRLVVLAPVHG